VVRVVDDDDDASEEEETDSESAASFVLASEAFGVEASVCRGLKKRIAEGSTETMSPGAIRVFAFECFFPFSLTYPCTISLRAS